MTTTINNTELISDIKDHLNLFTGSENFTKTHENVLCTEGAIYLANKTDCYWLIDIISIAQFISRIGVEEFQLYDITVNVNEATAIIECSDGNDNILFVREIQYTDFPLPRISLYYINGVLLLPSEY